MILAPYLRDPDPEISSTSDLATCHYDMKKSIRRASTESQPDLVSFISKFIVRIKT